jgi:hypothetical protein
VRVSETSIRRCATRSAVPGTDFPRLRSRRTSAGGFDRLALARHRTQELSPAHFASGRLKLISRIALGVHASARLDRDFGLSSYSHLRVQVADISIPTGAVPRAALPRYPADRGSAASALRPIRLPAMESFNRCRSRTRWLRLKTLCSSGIETSCLTNRRSRVRRTFGALQCRSHAGGRQSRRPQPGSWASPCGPNGGLAISRTPL